MAKQGEIDYFKNADEGMRRHALGKPFSDPSCGKFLLQIGTIMTILPPPPAKLLDLGCGTGWTSIFLARMGFEVTGVDIAPDMIHHANQARDKEGLTNLRFMVLDYEDLPFDEEFDCAVFFDSLHHAVDEELAIMKTFRALKAGGVCIASEPGTGHREAAISRNAVEKFNVTEKDMPPEQIVNLGRKAGFSRFRVFPHPFELNHFLFVENRTAALTDPFSIAPPLPPVRKPRRTLLRRLFRKRSKSPPPPRYVEVVQAHYWNLRNAGLVLMVK